MLPLVATANMINLASRYSIFLGQCPCTVLTFGIASQAFSNITNRCFGDLARHGFFTFKGSSLVHSILNVIRICSRKQVIWPNTRGIIAMMASKGFASIQLTSVKHKRVSVCQNSKTAMLEDAVTLDGLSSDPVPTTIRLSHTFPKVTLNVAHALRVAKVRTVFLVTLDFCKRLSACQARNWMIFEVDSHYSCQRNTLTPSVYC